MGNDVTFPYVTLIVTQLYFVGNDKDLNYRLYKYRLLVAISHLSKNGDIAN